jgi:hypothetical protein
MENILRMRRVADGTSSHAHRFGILSDGTKEWKLGFEVGLSEVECYRMAVGFARRVRKLVVTKDADGEFNYPMPQYLQGMTLLSCCEELEQHELTFSLKGVDA